MLFELELNLIFQISPPLYQRLEMKGNKMKSVILKSCPFHIIAGHPGANAACCSGNSTDFGAVGDFLVESWLSS